MKVLVTPAKDTSLILVRGMATDIAKLVSEVQEAEWADHVVLSEQHDSFTFHGLVPGRYTLVCARFGTNGAVPVSRVVDVLGNSTVDLTR